MTRSLSSDFFYDFKNGCFKSLIELIDNNGVYKSRFMLNLRGNCVIVYYKGVRVVSIYDKTKKSDSYRFEVQKKYETGEPGGYRSFYKSAKEVYEFDWKQFLLNIADGIDTYDEQDNAEKEAQQRIWYENNVARNANATDYFIIDTEYKEQGKKDSGRFDLIAFYWPAGKNRQGHKEKPKKISVIELKFGDNAVGGASDEQTATLSKHLKDFVKFDFSDDFLKDMTRMFFQLYDLGLINIKFGKNIKKHMQDVIDGKSDYSLISETDTKQMMFILANYNQKSDNLKKQKDKMKVNLQNDREIVFATSSFMGYGLYNVGMNVL